MAPVSLFHLGNVHLVYISVPYLTGSLPSQHLIWCFRNVGAHRDFSLGSWRERYSSQNMGLICWGQDKTIDPSFLTKGRKAGEAQAASFPAPLVPHRFQSWGGAFSAHSRVRMLWGLPLRCEMGATIAWAMSLSTWHSPAWWYHTMIAPGPTGGSVGETLGEVGQDHWGLLVLSGLRHRSWRKLQSHPQLLRTCCWPCCNMSPWNNPQALIPAVALWVYKEIRATLGGNKGRGQGKKCNCDCHLPIFVTHRRCRVHVVVC